MDAGRRRGRWRARRDTVARTADPQRRTIVFQSDDVHPEVMSASLPAGVFLLDVREDDEWAAGHAPDAVHVRLGELSARTEEIPRDRGVFVICRTGARSAYAPPALAHAG